MLVGHLKSLDILFLIMEYTSCSIFSKLHSPCLWQIYFCNSVHWRSSLGYQGIMWDQWKVNVDMLNAVKNVGWHFKCYIFVGVIALTKGSFEPVPPSPPPRPWGKSGDNHLIFTSLCFPEWTLTFTSSPNRWGELHSHWVNVPAIPGVGWGFQMTGA